MTSRSSEDDFNDLPDEFEGIDWDDVPEMNVPDPSLDPRPLTPSTGTITRPTTPPPRPASANSTSSYDFGDLDEDFLTQLDEIEEKYATSHNAGSSSVPASLASSHTTNVRFAALKHTRRSPKTAKRKASPAPENAPSKKFKHSPPATTAPSKGEEKIRTKAERDAEIRGILERYEDDMTCPICCDIFVAAHVTNPCGHTCCGTCMWAWVSKSVLKPTCAMCRAPLDPVVPIIQNFSVNSAVQRHVDGLIEFKLEGWEIGGPKLRALEARREVWKKESAERTKAKLKPPPKPTPVNRELINGFAVNVWSLLDDEESFDRGEWDDD